MRFYRVVPLAVLALCLPLTTGGCSEAKSVVFGDDFEFHCPESTAPDLSIAVGARANSPTPEPPTKVRKLIVASMQGCGKITVIRVDGRPSEVGHLTFSPGAKTKQNLDIDKKHFLDAVDKLIRSATARKPEANVLQALSVAADTADDGGTVVLLDSGVQTTDPLDFRKNSLPSRKPSLVVDALKRQHLLPDLSGRSVILAGIGYTAAPQTAIDEKNRDFLKTLWREIVIAAGVKAPVILRDPNTRPSAVRSPAVSIVKFPTDTISLGCDTLSVLPDNDQVGFVPDQARFRNPSAARAVLQKFARFLRGNPTAHVDIKGYVAHYGKEGDLSQRRADLVKRELSQWVKNPIIAKGMGWGPYPNVTAPPDKRYDRQNREVTIEVTCH